MDFRNDHDFWYFTRLRHTGNIKTEQLIINAVKNEPCRWDTAINFSEEEEGLAWQIISLSSPVVVILCI